MDKNNNQILPIDINDYPAVKNHLDKYYPDLEKRQDQGITPYNLRSLSYMDSFSEPKILYREISEEMNALYVEEPILINNKAYMITGDDISPLLADYLNSKVFIKLFLSSTNTTGGKGPNFLLNTKFPTALFDGSVRNIDELWDKLGINIDVIF